MKRMTRVSLCLTALCLFVAPAFVSAVEKKVKIDDVPTAVKATILQAAQGGRIRDIGEITENGKVVCYEVECWIEGKEIDVIVGPDGQLMGTEPQDNADEAEVLKKDAPAVAGKLTPAAAQAVKKAYPKARIKSVGVEGVGEHTIFKLIMDTSGKGWELEVAPGGTLVSTQRDVTEKAVPRSLRAELKKTVGGGKIVGLEKEEILAEIRGDKVVPLAKKRTIYEVKYMKDGSRQEAKLTAPAKPKKGFQSHFDVNKKNLLSTGVNPWFILVPGHRITLANDSEKVVITVLDETKVVDGVETRVVEEREWANGKLVEVSRNYFAIHKRSKNVYYFGEDVDDYGPDGKISGHGGAWLSGVNGAKFGRIMMGEPKVGRKYYQEQAPKAAMDRAEIARLDATLKTPAGEFKDVLYIRESSDLESGLSYKWYAPGIGMIGDDDLRLVKVEPAPGLKKGAE